jgi:polyisoprenyl-phosphate glycosyltransferase
MIRELIPGLTLVVPAYNEENGIVPTVERVASVLATLDIPTEIIVVNDGSSDGTAERLAAIKGIRVVSHPVNTGYGSAIKTGILCASYEWIGITDADSTYDIGLIPAMVEQMKKGFDMTVAARENVLSQDRPVKRFFRKALIKFLNLVVAKHIVDPNSGLRIFRREMAMTFFPFLCNTFSFTTSITIFALGEGYFIKYLPMQYARREGQSKVRHFRDSLRMMQLIIQGITFFNPLKLAVMLGFALFVAGFVPAAVLSCLGATTIASYWLALVSVGTVLFMLGILGDIFRLTGASRHDSWRPLVNETERIYCLSEAGDHRPLPRRNP